MKYLTFYFALILSFSIMAQEAQEHDIVLKTTGAELEGSVTKIDKDSISFNYKNEVLLYRIPKVDIVKITFATGRIEFFNKLKTESATQLPDKIPANTAVVEPHHNIVAVLPFAFIKDERDGSKSMSNKIQNEAYNLFLKYGKKFTFQDPTTTNALLIKAGVNNNNIQGYTMGELCQILGVEYIVQGVVSVEKTGSTTISNSYATTRSKTTDNKKRKGLYVNKHGHLVGSIHGSKGKGSTTKSNTSRSTVSSNIQNYKTSITMNVFNERGNNIYSRDHESFWNTPDAYKVTLKYLAKRSPFYTR